MTVSRALLLAASLSMASAAFAQSTYQQERARCLDGSSGEDQRTCLREAGAAAVEAKRGALVREDQNYQQNALARCAVHTNAEERSYCERRMRGEGTVSGSVKGGGLLRELTVVVPADQQ